MLQGDFSVDNGGKLKTDSVDGRPSGPSVWGPGMDLQVRIPPPVHYLIQQQASSLLAVQELRKDVDVLLEFREQVLGSLPHLTAPGAQGEPEKSSSKRHYPSLEDDISPRHNSSFDSGRSRKYGKSSVEATVVDSGFSTETKEAHSSVGKGQDELWLLLETIHRRGTRLKEYAQQSDTSYQRSYKPGRVRKYERKPKMDASKTEKLGAIQEDAKSPAHQFSSLPVGGHFDLVGARSIGSELKDGESVSEYASGSETKVNKVSLNELLAQVWKLRSERDAWMRKVSWVEAEANDTKACVTELQKQIHVLVSEKKNLEEQLHATLLWKEEFDDKIESMKTEMNKNKEVDGITKKIPAISVSWTEKDMETDSLNSNPIKPVTLLDTKDKTSACTQKKPSSLLPRSVVHRRNLLLDEGTRWHSEENLPRKQPSSGEHHSGNSARLISLPVEKVQVKPNKRKVSAILQENDVISLRRQLLTYVQGYEVLKAQWEASAREWNQRLEQLEETDKHWRNQVSSITSENDHLRFQLEEKNIELEGTKARLRVLEKLLGSSGSVKTDRGTDPATPSCTPKKHGDLLQESSEESSSTESLKARSERRTFYKSSEKVKEVENTVQDDRYVYARLVESSPTKKTVQRSSSRESDSSSHHGKVSNFVSKRNAKNLEGAQGKKTFVRSIEREQQKREEASGSPVILEAPLGSGWASSTESPLAHIQVALQWSPLQEKATQQQREKIELFMKRITEEA